MEETVALRIIVLAPLLGVAYGLRGKGGVIVGRQDSTGADLSFDLSLRVRRDEAGAPRFLGEFTEGPPHMRFVYLRIGTLAGQADSPWTRAQKIQLGAIDWPLVEAARGGRLETRVAGIDKRGAPSCATVPLVGGWRARP